MNGTKQLTAISNVESGSINITESRELLLLHTVTKVEMPTNASSVTFHGGGSGKF